jgi:hypothetical protein
VAALPRVVLDALEVVKQLKISYLWVDAFCIRQGDRIDWETEASRMSDIYSGSTLTLVASEGIDSSSEFFSPPRVGPDRHVFRVARLDPEPDLLLQIESRGGYKNSRGAELQNRGWTLQESVLACRIIQFPQAELQWRCQTSWLTEFGASYGPLSLIYNTPPLLSSLQPENWNRTWWTWAQSYTDRDLTVQTDHLPAIAGLIRYYEAITGDKSVVGLWKRTLAQDLLWMRLGLVSEVIEAKREAVRSLNLPTWTWLSCPAAVEFDFFTYFDMGWNTRDHATAEIQRVSWKNEPYFSQIEYAALMLSGPAKEVHLEKATTLKKNNPPYWIVDHEIPDLSEKPLNYKCIAQFDIEGIDCGRWLCILLRSQTLDGTKSIRQIFLIVESTGDLNTFRRVGTGVFRAEEPEFDLGRQRTITLL